MMIAAIYARKSTEQAGVADEQKSIARQAEHARAYAARKGWTVAEEHVYVDDGISGAEFANRPGFLRMMNALKPRAPFQVLIMSEESRLGREAIETAYALKQLVQAGVRIFFYMEDRERTLDSPTDKIMMSLTAFADELEREKARQRTYDAMLRKAKAGHVTGGRVFGYDNVEVVDASGQRSHVERRINEGEAAIVRRIFALKATGVGQNRITKLLNADRAVSPRSQQDRPRSWAPSSVREVLFRDLYRGVIVWNRTRKRNRWGQHQQAARPAEEWLEMPAPHLAIVSAADWQAAHARLERDRVQYDQDTHTQRRPARDRDSKYLLPSFARCGLCNGGLHVRTGTHGRGRRFSYACSSHYKRGPEVCPHVEQWPMEAINQAVLTAIAGDVLAPDVIEDVVKAAREMFTATNRVDDREQHQQELETLEREQGRLTEAMAAAGAVPALVERLKATEAKRRDLAARLETARIPGTAPAWREIERRVRQKLADWRSLLAGDVAENRKGFRELLTMPIVFTPFTEDGRRGIRFEGRVGLAGLFSGTLVTQVASPPGTALSYEPVFRGEWVRPSRAA